MTITPKKPAPSLAGVVLIYLLLALTVFYGAPFLLTITGLPGMNGCLFLQSRISIWASVALLYLYATRVEKQPFLLWPEQRYKPLFYVGSIIACLIIIAIGSGVLITVVFSLYHGESSPKLLEYVSLLKNNIPLLIFTALTAGVTEEIAPFPLLS